MTRWAAAWAGTSLWTIAFLFAMSSHSPVRAGSNAERRGAELFATKGCAHCHGPAGVDGNIGPDLQLVRKRLDSTQIFAQIHDGGKAMPAFADQLSTEEIDDLVAYLRARRKLVHISPKKPAEKSEASDSN